MPTILHLTREYAQKTSLARIRRDFGEKAYGIAMLQRFSDSLGFSVPQTWAINHAVNNRFLENNNITKEAVSTIYHDNSRKTVKTSSKRTLSVLGGREDLKTIYSKAILPKFETGHFSLKDEKELRDTLDLINQSQLLLKMISDQSDSIYLNAQELDFQRFSDIIKGIFAKAFDPIFWSRTEEDDNSQANDGIIIQEVPGHVHLIRGQELFFPVYSGITTIEPYSPITTISYRNLGLNSGKSHGDFFDKVAVTIDPQGKEQYSFSTPQKLPARWIITCLKSGNRKKISTVNPAKILTGRNTIEDLGSTFMKADNIARKFYKRYGSPKEIEWSFDEGSLNLHQISYPDNNFASDYAKPVEIKDVAQESVIVESRSICGHGELELPLIIPRTDLAGKLARTAIFGGQINELRRKLDSDYILAVDIVETLKDKEIGDIMHSLAGMSGVINLSDGPLPLASHWMDWFRENNILVISKKDLNWDLLNRICDIKKALFMYSSYPVRMAVDLKSQRGQIHLINQE